MALGGCYTCLKYLMFVFNFIFWLVGCALLAVGIWAKVDEGSLAHVIKVEEYAHAMSVGAWVLIVVGAIIFILGFLGCCGAIRESQCMLATFFVLLFVIFAALLAIGIYIFVKFKDDSLTNTITEAYKIEYQKYRTDNETRERIDEMQKTLHCCGPQKGDCKASGTYHYIGDSCGPKCAESEGCAAKMVESFKKNKIILIAVALGVAVIMLLGMIFSMLLCCAIREVA